MSEQGEVGHQTAQMGLVQLLVVRLTNAYKAMVPIYSGFFQCSIAGSCSIWTMWCMVLGQLQCLRAMHDLVGDLEAINIDGLEFGAPAVLEELT